MFFSRMSFSFEIFNFENSLIGLYFSNRPSTSKNENLPLRFYEAEMNGHLNLCNEKYKKCPVSLFDFISFIK